MAAFTPGQPGIPIDGGDVLVSGTYTITEGSGEDAESWSIHHVVLADGGDGYVETYKNEVTLYTPTAATAELEAFRRWEETANRKVSGSSLKGQALPEGSHWFGEGEDADGMIMKIKAGSKTLYLRGIPLVELGADGHRTHQYVSGYKSAREVPVRHEALPLPPAGEGGGGLIVGGLCALGLAFWLLVSSPPASLNLLVFFVGVCLALFSYMSDAYKVGVGIFNGAIGLYVGLSVLLIYREMALASAAVLLAGCFVFATGLAFASDRQFFILADAGRISTLIGVGSPFCILLLICFADEDFSWMADFGDWFEWLGPVAFIALIVVIVTKLNDYARVPVTAVDLTRLRKQAAQGLRYLAESPEMTGDARAVANYIDDFIDALRLAPDPGVRRFLPVRADLERAHKLLLNLAKATPATEGASGQALASELEVLAEDIGGPLEERAQIRVSPKLLYELCS